MKRFLAILVTIVMMATLLVPSMAVFADEADYSDYVPGAMPTDIVTNSWPYEGSTGNMSFGWSGIGYASEAQWVADTDIACTSTSYYGAMGKFIKQGNINETLEPGASYVFSAKIKNAGAEGTNPSFGIWFWKIVEDQDDKKIHYRTFPVEYGANGFVPGREFEDYSVTIVAPEQGVDCLGLGFVTAASGDILQLDWSEGIYFAKEEAYNITNEVVGYSSVFAGNSVTLDAKVVNQVGSAGTLDQAMTFVALDADRTAPVDGFTFTANGDGTTSVEVADTVAVGKYILLAQSDVYSGFQKGATIEVVSSEMYADSSVGIKPTDLITSSWPFKDTNDLVDFGWSNGQNTEAQWKAKDEISGISGEYHSMKGTFIIPERIIEPVEANTTYVFHAKFKTVVGTPKFEVYYSDSSNVKSYANEYPYGTYTPGSEFEDYKITLTTVGGGGGLKLGFSNASSGDTIQMDYSEGIYFAKETPYEIVVASADTKVIAGNSTTVNAQVLNQIGIKGTLLQNFEYVVLNADRTEFVDKITVTEGANGTATVNVASDVESGDYVIFVNSEDYPSLKKGIKISVINTSDFQDNATAPKVNLVLDPDNISYFLAGNGHSGFGDNKKDEYFTWKDSVDLSSTNDIYYMAGASFIRRSKGHLSEDAVWTVGDTFVYSIRLKNDTPEIDAAPLFGFSFGSRAELKALVSFPVTNTEDYETYTGYYKSIKERNYISLGFARPDSCIPHTATNAVINMDISNGGSLFVAKEAATEITNEVTGDTELLPGESTIVEAEILNQINEKGNVDQSITWFALNADRTRVVDGITVTDNGDGTATVDVDEDVATGDYVILAMSDSYPLRKGATISVVNSKARVVYTEIFTIGDDKASFNASVEGLICDTVKFVIASYNTAANKLIEAKEVELEVADGFVGMAGEEVAPVVSIAGADEVRVFVWDADTLAPIKFSEGVRSKLWYE